MNQTGHKITSSHWGYADGGRGYAVSDNGQIFRCYGNSVYGDCTAWQQTFGWGGKLNSVFVLNNKVLLQDGNNIYAYVIGENGFARVTDNKYKD